MYNNDEMTRYITSEITSKTTKYDYEIANLKSTIQYTEINQKDLKSDLKEDLKETKEFFIKYVDSKFNMILWFLSIFIPLIFTVLNFIFKKF